MERFGKYDCIAVHYRWSLRDITRLTVRERDFWFDLVKYKFELSKWKRENEDVEQLEAARQQWSGTARW